MATYTINRNSLYDPRVDSYRVIWQRILELDSNTITDNEVTAIAARVMAERLSGRCRPVNMGLYLSGVQSQPLILSGPYRKVREY